MSTVNQTQSGSKAVPIALVLGGTGSVQLGAALAVNLFDELGPAGTVFLRALFAAVVLVAITRPTLRGRSREAVRTVIVFGIALGLMNFSFYEALDRIPLGIAVTLEFVGPLGVAIATSRSRSDLVWAAMAAIGIVLLGGGVGGELDAFGVLLALVAGAFWAAYIVLAQRVGREFPGFDGIAIAMVVATAVVVVPGIADAGSQLLEPDLLAIAFGVSILSSAIPYSVEMEALRRLAAGTFGVMMSLEPAVAALVGFLVLGQDLAAAEVVAVGLVVAASAGALSTSTGPPARDA